ncbi:MAG: ABC transporter ATP-binding protein [Oscillospiraceae bacterium]|jgi:putative ABC transport system ATP-binding protein|nr:ABC transporter ATP-binding protein [Oscillospiraceae bacterium]
MNAQLRVEHVEKYYGAGGLFGSVTKALDDVSFSVERGEFVGVMGPSGSGKTTLLNVISTLDTVSAGRIWLDGRDASRLKEREIARFRRENLGFIFQEYNLLESLTLRENIALALSICGRAAGEIPAQVERSACQLGIGEVLDRFPWEVSGGQRQRCACARAIASRPGLILADEPTGALDSQAAQMLMETLSDMNARLPATILMVTHDAFSASYCRRILFLKDGRIFSELLRGDKDRRTFFGEILDVMALLGGSGPQAFLSPGSAPAKREALP